MLFPNYILTCLYLEILSGYNQSERKSKIEGEKYCLIHLFNADISLSSLNILFVLYLLKTCKIR